MTTLDLSGFDFHPVIAMPADYEVFDFTRGYDAERALRTGWGVGRYDERRVGMYTTALFEGVRDVHVGVDLAAPVGTPVHAFWEAEVHRFGDNPAPGDYGFTVVTRHALGAVTLWALHGHLSARSVEWLYEGRRLARGEVFAWVGDRHENGGWNPHLHFQLSLEEPAVADLPGVVSVADREAALAKYPDPRLVLGPLY